MDHSELAMESTSGVSVTLRMSDILPTRASASPSAGRVAVLVELALESGFRVGLTTLCRLSSAPGLSRPVGGSKIHVACVASAVSRGYCSHSDDMVR